MANRNPLEAVIADIEDLEAEKAQIDEQIRERKKQAKQDGFSLKMINRVLKRRKMTEEQRSEEDALLQIYEGALGMLGGTPLGEAALRRLSQQRAERADDDTPDMFEPEPAGAPAAGGGAEGHLDDTVEVARQKGADAAKAGIPVTGNPYPPRTPQRAGWDEAWCQALGSDGMDLPAAWRPNPKPKKGKEDDGEAGGEE
ncbi:GapR family DNA-binding domain-containing protein [Caulobacter sp. CCNWLY153]|uniref:DUF2312 domain-containing protein n=1 Tax=unclassified Caulobacter TaxID=2648921 RepID=UPI002FF30E27